MHIGSSIFSIALIFVTTLSPTCMASQEAPAAPSMIRTSRAQPDSEGVYQPINGVSRPKLIYSVAPEFSETARKKKLSGVCKVSLIVEADGNVRDIKVIHSIAEDQPLKLRKVAQSLDAKAVEAVHQYHFEPGLLEGKPVPVSLTVEVAFQIF